MKARTNIKLTLWLTTLIAAAGLGHAVHGKDATNTTPAVTPPQNYTVIAVDYAEYGQRAMRVMDERPAALGVTYFPHVSMGWDGSPRNYSMGIVLNNTPEKWGDLLRQTKVWLDRHPESPGIVTLNSWNEWVEGSYLEPDTVNGMKCLEAVRDVFGTGRSTVQSLKK